MKAGIFLFYVWLLKAGLWQVILYRRYRCLPNKITSFLSHLGLNFKNKFIPMHIEGYNYPVWARFKSTDLDVFYQIFIEEEYSCLAACDNPKLIVDCGANVGYSSIYFLNKYPQTRVIAVEPDEANFQVCQKNLLPYGERVSLIRSGIWSHQAGLVICEGNYGKGHEWAIQVLECQAEQKPDIVATSISDLLEKSEFKNIDLLKVDIEGSEKVIFAHNYESWLDRVQNLVIELHDEECEKTFFKAMSKYKYDLSQSGELTVCQKIVPNNCSELELVS
jgi:FkbM family methyltransferase